MTHSLTCIIGVVCEDGIVLVGDKKIKVGSMARYENKLFSVKGYRNLMVAAAGLTDVRDKFIQDMENLPLLLKEGIVKEDPSRGSVGLTEDIAYRLMQIYKPRYEAIRCDYVSEAFEALVCHKPKSGRPFIYSIDAVGNSSKVQDYMVLGTGRQYAYLFLKSSYHETAFMNGMAVIAAFIILLIDQLKIDESIGVDEEGKVQVWKFPNNADPYEVKDSELDNIMKEAQNRLKKFTNFLVLGRTKL